MKLKALIIATAGAVFLTVALLVFLLSFSDSPTLEFVVRDAVSKAWVWDMEASIQNTVTNGFFQSDRGLVPFVVRGLSKGPSTLTISAPSYKTVEIPLTIRRGRNSIKDPIELSGIEIEDLKAFFAFEERVSGGYTIALRPVSAEGMAIEHHPCLDIWVGAVVSEQVKNGAYVTEPVDEGSERGALLYKGELPWQWDPNPETQFRYKASLEEKLIASSPAPYLVIDYLIVVPKPGVSKAGEIAPVLEKAWSMESIDKALSLLDAEENLFSYYLDSSWNVRR